jgi:LysM repeat protein
MRDHHFALALALILLLTCAACASTAGKQPTVTTTAAAVHVTNAPAADSTAVAASGTALPTPSPLPVPRLYSVQEGDTLFDIAQKFDVTVESIVALNQISDPALIRPGQMLYIPDSNPRSVTAPTPVNPGPGPQTSSFKYTVQEGDTLFDIALKYGVTIESVVTLNEIAIPELIHPGQVLLIPGESSAQPRPTAVSTSKPIAGPDSSPISYTIQSGDTLFDIALRYGVTVDAIVAANQIPNPASIRPGQTLVIPAESAAKASVRPGLTATPLPAEPASITVNSIPLTTIVVMPPAVRQHLDQIYREGQKQGRNPHAFAKVGDSTVQNGFFFMLFDHGGYDLGDYSYLQPAINFYAGSFARNSVAVGIGYHTTTVLDPLQTNPACFPNETLIECEFRLTNPSVVVIRLGANDVGMPDVFDRKLRQMVEYAIGQGVIPILGTKADRQDPSNIINTIIRQVAADNKIPLWDFDAVAETLPNRGLASDGVHPTNGFARDYSKPETFQRGHEMQDLTALMALDAVWREVTQAKP